MDFRNALELAFRKQQRRDKEVSSITFSGYGQIQIQLVEELSLQRKNERYADIERANQLRSRVNSKHHVDQNPESIERKPSPRRLKNDDAPKKVVQPPKERSVRKNNIPSPTLSSKETHSSSSHNSMEQIKSRNVPSVIQPKNDSPVPKVVKSKPSFIEMLEVAKKNVDHQATKRKPFDDLIPCTSQAKYRSVNSMPNPSPSQLTRDSRTNIPAPLVNPVEVKQTGPPVKYVKAALDNKASHFHIQSTSRFEKESKRTISDSVPSTKPKSAIAAQRVSSSHMHTTQNGTSSVPKPKLLVVNSELLLTQASPKTVREIPVKPKLNKISTNSNPQLKPQVAMVKKTDQIPHSRKEPPRPSPTFVQSTFPSASASRRGIAAQLGIHSTSQAIDPEDDYDYDNSDEYASDDSFIDDSQALESKEYARVVRDVHQALRFDPRKYKEINPFDDLRSMEANYREIEKEEKRSARLGALEDAVELERDMEHKRQKYLQAKNRPL